MTSGRAAVVFLAKRSRRRASRPARRGEVPHLEDLVSDGPLARASRRAFSQLPFERGLLRRVDEVALALDRIGGEAHAPTRVAGVEGVPVHGDAPDEQLTERLERAPPVVLALVEGRQEGPAPRGQTGLADPGQGWLRPDLHEDLAAQAVQGHDAVGKAHRLLDVSDPVVGARELVPGQGAREVLDERDAGLEVGDLPGHRAELLEHRVHEGRVEGVGDLERASLDAFGLESTGDPLDRVGAAGDHVLGPVDGGDRDVTVHRRNRRSHALLVRHDGDHPALPREAPHQASPLGKEPEPVLQAEDAGHAGGHVLPRAVPDHEVRLDAPALPHLAHRPLECEEGRLRERSVVDRRLDTRGRGRSARRCSVP